MARISYVNGRYVNHKDAFVHIEDRGYQFSDGVYEVIAFYNHRMLDGGPHLARLMRSLRELRIEAPMSQKELQLVIDKLVKRNEHKDGTIYIQISRGVAKRNHPFPAKVRPSVVMSVTGPKMPKAKEVKDGVSVITLPDSRWARRDIKSISLLANILAKQSAAEAGAKEAWLYDSDGYLREGSASNNAIINKAGEIITSPANQSILSGITRNAMLDIARKNGFKVKEKPFNLKEVLAAKEAFMMSTTLNLLPVVSIDGKKIGTGKPGETTLELLHLYYDHIYKQTGKRWK